MLSQGQAMNMLLLIGALVSLGEYLAAKTLPVGDSDFVRWVKGTDRGRLIRVSILFLITLYIVLDGGLQ